MTTPQLRNRSPYRARSMNRSGQQFHPATLGHTALYDANNGGSTTQITDSGILAVDPLAFAASTAAPTYLAAPGLVPYVYMPAVSGNTISTPDSAAFAFTGDQDVRWCGTAVDWTPAANVALVSQDSGGAGGRRFDLTLNASGRLTFIWSADGTNVLTKSSTVALPLVDGSPGCVRATLDVDDGASQNVVRFYHKTGSTYAELIANTGWTLLDTVTTATATSVSALSTAAVRVAGSSAIAAAVTTTHAAAYLDGIDGTVVADFDASLCGQTGYVASTCTWAMAYGTSGIHAVVKSTAANDVVAGVVADASNDYATGPTAAIPALTAADACTLYTVARPRATMVSNMTFFSTRNGSGAGVTLRMASATTVVADISDGTSTVTTGAVTIVPGTRYVLGVVVPVSGGAYCFANNTAGSTQARTGNTETGGALTVFANSTPTNFAKVHARIPYAALPYAASSGNIANLVTYYGGGV